MCCVRPDRRDLNEIFPVIGTDGRVLALKYGTDAYDQCSVDELLALARKHAPAKQEPGLSLGRTQEKEIHAR